jgi:hypothetical protein
MRVVPQSSKVEEKCRFCEQTGSVLGGIGLEQEAGTRLANRLRAIARS